jgi:hypothetical protein
MQNMEQWLKVKTAGLPRWAWVLLLGGALGAGIYIRTRHQEEQFGPEEEPVEEPESGLAQYEGTEQAGGLAAAGLVGPAQGQITPVESPVIPEGVVDIIGAQNETLSNAIGALAEREPGERVETSNTTEIEGEGQVERENVRRQEREEREKRHHKVTGGGAPNRKPHHKPPPKPKQKKHRAQNAKALNPKRHKPGRRRRVGRARSAA